MPGQITTPGKYLLSEILPEDIQVEGPIEKKTVNTLFSELASKYPDKYIDILDRLNRHAVEAATEYGDTTSFSLDDLSPPPKLQEYRKRLKERVDNITQSRILTPEQKNDKVVELMRSVVDDVRKKTMEEGSAVDNRLVFTGTHGFRGNPVQITQMLFGDLLMADHKGRPVPLPGLHGYGEGVTPSEYWAGSYGARSGFADVQLKTQDAGFLTKKLAVLPNQIKITGEDCGAQGVGIPMDKDDPDILGHVTAVADAGFPKNHPINKNDLQKMDGEGDILVRSVLTCQQPTGVCQKCSGLRESGEFPAIGDYIGVEYARIAGEPITQGALGQKHVGGLVESKGDLAEDFSALQRLFGVPHHFAGAAILTPVEGKVDRVVEAPQGGKYVLIGTEQIHVPEDRATKIKKGDVLEKGDVLSEGIVNPAEIIKYKGIGAGRVYFLKQLQDMLHKNNAHTHIKNLEPIAREFFNRVRITDQDAFEDYDYGDLIPYTEIQRTYKPRKGATLNNVQSSKGKYLERPILEYSIGTEVTPSIIKRLKSKGVDDIIVHDKPPSFSPEVVRLDDIVSTDPDFKVRMGGWGTKKSFLEAARRGAVSKKDSPSYIPFLMSPGKPARTRQN